MTPSERPECSKCEDPAVSLNGLCAWHEAQEERYEDMMDDWEDCSGCGGDGYADHDCGEDTCCCARPAPTICRECNGTGGWDRRPKPAVAEKLVDPKDSDGRS